VTVSPAVAEEAQIHMTMDGAGGTSMMHAVQALELPADAEVVLEPGGYHVMLIELVEPLAAGDEFDLTLEFAQAPDATVTVEVRDDAP
jgi:copper(I)-binding protein